jgi:hypothetical protein
MAYLCVVINASQPTIQTLNDVLQATKPNDSLARLADVISALEGGALNGVIQLTTRGTDPGVTTDGASGSTQISVSKA